MSGLLLLNISHFILQIFFSCGADGAVRLWVWDVFEPVITLTIGPNPVEDAAWSPRNSTVIASISDCNLYLWDLRRKTYYPASTIVHPQQIKFCTIKVICIVLIIPRMTLTLTNSISTI